MGDHRGGGQMQPEGYYPNFRRMSVYGQTHDCVNQW
jgi:hypothetical protein